MEEKNGTGWSLATAFWAFVALIFVLAVGVVLWNVGNNKAELASAIQRIAGEQQCMQQEVNKTTDRVDRLAPSVSRMAGQFEDFRCATDRSVNRLYNDLYNPYLVGAERGGCNGGCDNSRYTRRDAYTLSGSTLEYVDVCRS